MTIATNVYFDSRFVYSGLCDVPEVLRVCAADVKEVVDDCGITTFTFPDILQLFTQTVVNCPGHGKYRILFFICFCAYIDHLSMGSLGLYYVSTLSDDFMLSL